MNFTTILSENFSALLATVSSLTGVLIGSLFTWVSQKKSFQRQIAWEEKKHNDEKLYEVFNIYNKVLERDGALEVVDYNRGHFPELKAKIYSEEIRPILYEKFHLLHSDIIESIRKLDELLLKWTIVEEAEDDEIERAASIYWSIIDSINRHIENVRVD